MIEAGLKKKEKEKKRMINWRFPSEYRSGLWSAALLHFLKYFLKMRRYFLLRSWEWKLCLFLWRRLKEGCPGEKSKLLHRHKLKKLSFRERAKTILHEVSHFLLHHANYLRPVFLDHKSHRRIRKKQPTTSPIS